MGEKVNKLIRRFVKYIKRTGINKLMAVLLVIVGCLPLWIDNDATLLIIMTLIAVPLFCTKNSCLYKV